MYLWFAVDVFAKQLFVCGVALMSLWFNCLCHLWWHRQLRVFVVYPYVPSFVAQTVGLQKLH
jgi:hypothetical protein